MHFDRNAGKPQSGHAVKKYRRRFPGETIAMTCAEFQKVLPYIIDGGGSEEEQKHLETCQVCSDLVADLRYIAEAAKLLVPMEEPSPRVWSNIEKEVEREGLAKPVRRNT
jgi:hypothetical protein